MVEKATSKMTAGELVDLLSRAQGGNIEALRQMVDENMAIIIEDTGTRETLPKAKAVPMSQEGNIILEKS